MKNKKLKRYTAFDWINTSLVVLITIMIAYPLYFCVIASFSDPNQVAVGNTLLWIKGFTMGAYDLIWEEKLLWTSYRNTIIYTILGTLYNLALTLTSAYVLSKQYIPFHGFISWYFFITMYIGGGMIPTYLLCKSLNLINNPLILVIGQGVSVYNMIVTRQYFATSIHPEIYEAARIDGAGEGRCFTTIAMPLAKPIVAVMALYYGVGHWNAWYEALLYIYNKKWYPLQLVLRNILIQGQLSLSEINKNMSTEEVEYLIFRARMAQSMKYSIVIVASVPLLIIYPFLQKYFAKGIMVGSVKG